MIVKFEDDVNVKEAYEEIRDLFHEAEGIEGVKKADVFLSSSPLRNRYDMMIRVTMKKTALSSFDGSDLMKTWDERYGDQIAHLTVFDK